MLRDLDGLDTDTSKRLEKVCKDASTPKQDSVAVAKDLEEGSLIPTIIANLLVSQIVMA